jgi:dTDP-glucose pyrophosphorylase
MLNVLVLAAEDNGDALDQGYPSLLSEFKGTTLLEHIAHQVSGSSGKLTIAVSLQDFERFNFSKFSKIGNLNVSFYPIKSPTAGATCTALVATDEMDDEDSLLILNGNEFLKFDFLETINRFIEAEADAGTTIFKSIHPRYSFVRIDSDLHVLEAAEKTPISDNATAGFYWFAKKKHFRLAAHHQLLKKSSSFGKFYICPLFNEMLLSGQVVLAERILNDQYIPMKTQRQFINQEGNLE